MLKGRKMLIVADADAGMWLLIILAAMAVLVVFDRLRGLAGDLTFTVKEAKRPRPMQWPPPESAPATAPMAPPALPDGPGKYRIIGVDRATKMDTSWVVYAESRASAAVKGDLEGIAVVSIDRV